MVPPSNASLSSYNGIRTVLFPAAVLALEPGPYGVEVVDGGIHEVGLVGQDASLEVTGAGALHAKACAGEVGGTDISGLEVEDDDLEMDTRAKDTLQARKEDRVAVEVFPEVRPRLLGMDEAHFLAFLYQVGQNAEERSFFHIEVLDVGRAYPEGAFHLGGSLDYFLEVSFVCDVLSHSAKLRIIREF